MSLTALDLLIIALATWRLSFALALETLPFSAGVHFRALADRFSPRNAGDPKYAAQGSIYDLVTCPLCLSFWLAPLVWLAYQYVPLVVVWFALAGAALWLHRSGK